MLDINLIKKDDDRCGYIDEFLVIKGKTKNEVKLKTEKFRDQIDKSLYRCKYRITYTENVFS